MNAIGFFGSHILSAGVYEGECISHIQGDIYKKLFVKDKSSSALFSSTISSVRVSTALVREKRRLRTSILNC